MKFSNKISLVVFITGTHPKVSVLMLFVILFFLLGSNLQAAVDTQSTENGNIKSPVKEIQLSPKEKAWLQDKHIVRVRVGNYPPLMFGDGGEIRGIAIDYVNLIFTRNGIKFKYISGGEVTWPEALEYIRKHEVVDMVPTVKVTQKRKEYMLFTNEYIFAPWVIFTREDSDFISTIDDLKGKTVSVQEGYVMHKKLEREYPEINLLVSSANSIDYPIKPIKDVSFGQADAFIGNLLMTTYMLQAQGYTNVKVAAPTPFGNHNQSMGIRNDWPELVSIINKTLDSMTPAEHAAIRNKWLSMRFEYGISPTDVLKWVAGIIGVAALILVIILLWNRKLSREIQERKKAEEALEESESRFREMFEQSPFGIALIGSLTGQIYALNPKFVKISGRTVEEMIKLDWMTITHPDDVQEDLDNMALLNAGKINGFNMDKRYIRPDGSHVWINVTIAPVAVEDKAHPRHLCMIDDITERKQAEEQIKQNLKEKEILLSEIHHRVKNNMQVISSLLKLQSAKIEDKKYVEMFKESENRIRSMSLIHEKLYQSGDFANVDFNGYVKSIANDLIRSYAVTPDKIKLNTKIEDVSLGLDNAIPCGLIVNEIISNSLKYAFPKDREGEINIVLREINSHEIEFTVSDDGIGIPAEMDIRETESLGLQLVQLLAENQLDGKIEVDRDGGTAFRIRFKN